MKMRGFSAERFARRGFTLVEVGIAATLAAVVMAGATTLTVAMLRNNGAVQQRLEQIAVRSRLAEAFRTDVTAARTCSLDDQNPAGGIILRSDEEHAVRYVPSENRVARIVETGGKATSRETFTLGSDQHATLTMTSDAVRLVRCTIETPAASAENRPPGVKPRPALMISAVLGRQVRLAEMVRQAVRLKTAPAPPPKASEEPAP
ncbi:MAG TPA: hypothetical protein VMF30_18110 [Pirellulales bacterium]|nr:hypothetical protein [Pirellulales bacterium]